MEGGWEVVGCYAGTEGGGVVDCECGAGLGGWRFWGFVGWLAGFVACDGSGGSGWGGWVVGCGWGCCGSSLLSIATRNAMGKQTPFT